MSDSPLTHASLIARLLEYADAADGRFQERALDCDYEALTRDLHKAAALLADTRAATPRCANCGHTAPHNGPAGEIADACTHPSCRCAYFVAEDTRVATEGSAAEAERERIIKLLLDRAEVDNNIVKPGLWFAAGWIRQNSPAASAPTRETGWRDISTAPKDGTKIWLWWDGEKRPAHWHEALNPPSIGGRFANWLTDDRGTISAVTKPTMWHPFPADPLPPAPVGATPPRDERPQTAEREG